MAFVKMFVYMVRGMGSLAYVQYGAASFISKSTCMAVNVSEKCLGLEEILLMPISKERSWMNMLFVWFGLFKLTLFIGQRQLIMVVRT